MKSFDAARARRLARKLSFPRLVGSPGEPAARAGIRETLADCGIEAEETPFRFYPVLSFGILLELIGAGALLLALHRVLLSAAPRWGAAAGLVIPLVARRLWRSYRRAAAGKLSDQSAVPPRRFTLLPWSGYQFRSANLTADLPCRGPIKNRLVLSAHTDSKSQNMSILTRIVASVAFATGVYLLPLATAPGLIAPDWITGRLSGLWWGGWVVSTVSALILLRLKITNESPGATDNAAACGALLETARALSADPPQGVAVRLLLTGAEEMGLAGAYHYVRSLPPDSPWRQAVYLNLEGSGEGRKIWLATGTGPNKQGGRREDRALELAEAACRAAEVKTGRLGRFVGGEADHIPLLEAGLSAVTLMPVSRNAALVHTAKDGPELLREEDLAVTGRILGHAIRLLES